MSKKKKKESKPAEAPADAVIPEREPAPEEPVETETAETTEAEPLVKSIPLPAPEQEALETRFLRLQADFENFRRRTQREESEWTRQAQEDIFTELLSVIDHFEMGMKTAEEHHAESSVVQGFRLVYDQLNSLLTKFHVQAIEAVGHPFDPHSHEAMTQMPSDAFPPDVVASETRKGYRMKDKLLRPAQVLVSSGPGPESAAEAEPDEAPAEAQEEQV